MRTTHFASEFWVMSVMSVKPIKSHTFTSPWGWALRNLASILPMEVGNIHLLGLPPIRQPGLGQNPGGPAEPSSARAGAGLEEIWLDYFP